MAEKKPKATAGLRLGGPAPTTANAEPSPLKGIRDDGGVLLAARGNG